MLDQVVLVVCHLIVKHNDQINIRPGNCPQTILATACCYDCHLTIECLGVLFHLLLHEYLFNTVYDLISHLEVFGSTQHAIIGLLDHELNLLQYSEAVGSVKPVQSVEHMGASH